MFLAVPGSVDQFTAVDGATTASNYRSVCATTWYPFLLVIMLRYLRSYHAFAVLCACYIYRLTRHYNVGSFIFNAVLAPFRVFAALQTAVGQRRLAAVIITALDRLLDHTRRCQGCCTAVGGVHRRSLQCPIARSRLMQDPWPLL